MTIDIDHTCQNCLGLTYSSPGELDPECRDYEAREGNSTVSTEGDGEGPYCLACLMPLGVCPACGSVRGVNWVEGIEAEGSRVVGHYGPVECVGHMCVSIACERSGP